MDAAAGERACFGRRGAVAGGPAAQQRKAGRDAGRVLREAVEAVVGPARRAVRVAGRSSSGRLALFGEGMARQRLLRLPQAIVSSRVALSGRAGGGRRARRSGEGARPLCRAAVDRCDVPGELRGDQSRGDAAGAREPRREPDARPGEPDGRPAEGPHQPDRRPGFRGRPQPCRHPGQVVYENELIQLIQYAPTTGQVAARPLLIVPPCINKYYVLDLQPENSFVAHAVASGNTVFMLSWRNAGPEISHLTWDDYLDKGVLTASRAAREICGSDRVNALGFCVGGTLLGAALAVLAAKGDDAVASATLLTTMLDFTEAGQLGVFVDEASVRAREAAIGERGILPGSDLAFVFSSLRANDLVWPYVVNNYLLGGRPAAFDLLFWNSDSANLPGPMYCYYVRNTYLENRLKQPGALVNCGVPVDLGKVKLPVFVLSTREDHIVPWRSAYRTLSLLGEEKTFVLGASGHIAGIVNPPAKKRRSYWVGEPYPDDPDAWLKDAREERGSWWPFWSEWLARRAGGTRAAPSAPGSARYRPVEPAPGRYVKQKAN